MSDLTVRRAAVSGLGDELRRVAVAACNNEAALDEIAEATRLAAELATLLERHPRKPHHLPAVDDPPRNLRFFAPVRGAGSPIAPPIAFRPDGSSMLATFSLDARYEGMPGFAHGGMMAMLFDEVLGIAMIESGNWGMTASLDVSYRRGVPLDAPLVLRGSVSRTAGRKVWVAGTLAMDDAPSTPLATAEALMITPRPELAAEYFAAVVDQAGNPMTGHLGELGNG